MSKNFFRAKNGLNVAPTDASSVVNPEVGDIIVDSSDNNKLKRYDDVTASWKDVGSGVGGINYISTNSDFEGGTTGYAEYKDAPAESPVDATGGDALYTSISTTTSALRGTKSGLISKTANDAQGEGVSYDFTIDSADQAQVLRISFDYSTSVNYADGDIRIFVYDVTNSQLIQVIERDLGATSFGKYIGTFQTNSNSTSYRLIFHIATDKLLAYTVTVDNVLVGPQTIVKGSVTTNWTSFTPTGSWGNTTYGGRYRRIGDSVQVQYSLNLIGSPSGNLTVNLPLGLSPDSSKIVSNVVGERGELRDASVGVITNVSATLSGSSVFLTYQATATTDALVSATAPFTWVSGDSLSFTITVPILGWSSNMVLSEDAGNREIVYKAKPDQLLPRSLSSGFNKLAITKVYDTAGMDDSANDRVIIPESGYYTINAKIEVAGGSLPSDSTFVAIYKNGSSIIDASGDRIGTTANGSELRMSQITVDLYLTKGEYLELYIFVPSAVNLNIYNRGFFSIAKLSSPQTIAYQENPAPHKNYVINGNFDFWQRGTSLTSGTGQRFLADRFRNFSIGSTYTVSRQGFTIGQNEVPNNPSYFHRTVVSSVTGSSNRASLLQKIEGVKTLSNKQITVSFWAKADSNKPIAIEFAQNFGTGGAVTSPILGIGVKKVNLTTSWQKITHTVYIPSVTGSTVGSNANDFLDLVIWFDAGSTYNSRTDSLGQQSGTFDIAQIQIEEGSRAREFVLAGGNLEGELAACQRYYEKSWGVDIATGTATIAGIMSKRGASGDIYITVDFKAEKRSIPAIGFWDDEGNGGFGIDARIIRNSIRDQGFSTGAQWVATSRFNFVDFNVGFEHLFHWVADAEL